MRRVMGKVSDECYTELEHLLPYGSQERVIGFVIEDFISFCTEDRSRAINYIERNVKFNAVPRITISRGDALELLEILGKQEGLSAKLLSDSIRKELGHATG